eukprot:356120-Chlamydomonas_euryale.AAC.5
MPDSIKHSRLVKPTIEGGWFDNAHGLTRQRQWHISLREPRRRDGAFTASPRRPASGSPRCLLALRAAGCLGLGAVAAP